MRRFAVAVALAATFASSIASAQDIAPPPPIDPNAPGSPNNPQSPEQLQQQETERKLDEAEREDSGRNFELFWVRGDVGGSYIDMAQLSSETFQIEKAKSGGPAFGLAAGVRLVVFVLGARARYNALSAFNMWQLNGELGFRIPVSKLDIGFGLHGGYSFVGSLGGGSIGDTGTPASSDQIKIRGFNAGLDLGVDYYVSPMFSVGVAGLADFLFLNRPPIDKPANFASLPVEQQNAINNSALYQKSGQTAGLQLGIGLTLGLHFGL